MYQENAVVQGMADCKTSCLLWSSSETANKDDTRKTHSLLHPNKFKTQWENQCDKHGTKMKNRLFKPQTSSTSICFSNKNTPQTPSC
jgi:hypothetical protein